MSSYTFSSKKLHVRHPAVVDVGCNCKPKFKFSSFTSLFSSSSSSSSSNSSSTYSKAKSIATSSSTTTTTTNITATSSSWDPTATTTSHCGESTPSPPLLLKSYEVTRTARRRRTRRKKKASAAEGKEGRVARESVAVVKETTDPYLAFKESMLQMIVEKEIYEWDDLNDLLRHFLSLNSRRHHHLILRAFVDLWDGTEVAATPSSCNAVEDSPVAGAASPPPYGYYYYY